MRYATQLRRVAPTTHTPRGRRIASGVVRTALSLVSALALVASALLTGATLATVTDLLTVTLPTLLVAWVAAIGLTFALPMVVVRSVVAVVERTE